MGQVEKMGYPVLNGESYGISQQRYEEKHLILQA